MANHVDRAASLNDRLDQGWLGLGSRSAGLALSALGLWKLAELLF